MKRGKQEGGFMLNDKEQKEWGSGRGAKIGRGVI
jgi:hypothetical protein